jgi:hypothetical protein
VEQPYRDLDLGIEMEEGNDAFPILEATQMAVFMRWIRTAV